MSVRSLWLRWVLANSAGELLGLGVVAAAAIALVATVGEPAGPTAAIGFALPMVLLGAYEGVVVGWLQWWVLRSPLPGLARGRWVGATVLGAVAAWSPGMIPSTMFAPQAPGPEATPPTLAPATEALLALLLGAVAGTILAFPQARVLRHHVVRAWLWLPANALAWALGMVVIFRSAGTLPPTGGDRWGSSRGSC
jgi:hypothetical protein